jgi:molybdopterin/thiamine biosynthesis adenylyltransferase
VPTHMGYAQEAALAMQMHANNFQAIVLTPEDFVSIVREKWKREVYPNIDDVDWVVPFAQGVVDVKIVATTLAAIGFSGFKSYVKRSKTGKDIIILKGTLALRDQFLRGTKFLATNPKLVQMGVGLRGANHVARGGFVLGLVVSVGIESLDFIIDDEKTMGDLVGAIGIEAVKGGLAMAVGLGAAETAAGAMAAFGVVAGSAVAPLIICAVTVGFAAWGLNWLDNSYNIKAKVTQALKNAPQATFEVSMRQAGAFNRLGSSLSGWLRSR